MKKSHITSVTDFAAGRADLESGRVFLSLRLQTVQRQEGFRKRRSPIDKKKEKEKNITPEKL